MTALLPIRLYSGSKLLDWQMSWIVCGVLNRPCTTVNSVVVPPVWPIQLIRSPWYVQKDVLAKFHYRLTL